MNKIAISILVVLFVVSSVVAPALASDVHLKPPNKNPSFTDNGLTLNTAGNLAGLGYGDVLVNLVATANPIATCTNPGGQSKVPGHNPNPLEVSGSISIPSTEIKNGNTPFSVTTIMPPTIIIPPTDPNFSCPNDDWTEKITDIAFISATITVEQPVGTTVLEVACEFNPQTSDGEVPDATVNCGIVK